MMASSMRTLLRASVASISRPIQPTRLPQTFTRAYSRKSPLHDPPPPSPPPHTEPTPEPTPPAPLPSVPTLDFGTEEPAARIRTGAKSAKDSLSSIERRRRRLGWVSSGLLVAGLVGGYIYLGREPDEKIDLDHKSKIGAWIARSNRRTLDMFDYFNKPIWKELLPPPLPPGYQKPYTLVLSIDDLLVTSVWDRQHGWRTAKRPGVDYFLQYLSQFFEIVIFTTQNVQTAYPIMDKLDPFQFSVLYQLFRESTRSVNGKIVKDLSYLNRDLSKVIAIDTVAERYSSQPENAIILPKWKGDPNDTGLVGLIPFLESIGILNPPDVRPILKAYQGKDIAKEYAKVEAANKARLVEEWKAKHKSNAGLASGGFTISRLFSRDPDPTHNLPSNSADGMPLTYLEQKRLLAQKQYRDDVEFLRKNHDMLKKQKEEAQEAQMKEMMQEGLWGALSRMGLGPAPPKDPNSPSGSTSSVKQG